MKTKEIPKQRRFGEHVFASVRGLNCWLYVGKYHWKMNGYIYDPDDPPRKRVCVYPPTRKDPRWRVVVEGDHTDRSEKFHSGRDTEKDAFATAVKFACA